MIWMGERRGASPHAPPPTNRRPSGRPEPPGPARSLAGPALTLPGATAYTTSMTTTPRMVRVRQTFARPQVADIPATTRASLSACGHPIKRGDVVAVGTSSRGINNYAAVMKATVDHLLEL